MPPLRLLLVDDHALFREGLIALLSYQDDFTVVGEAEDAATILDRARALAPDIVLMDIELPGEDGVSATRRPPTASPAAGCPGPGGTASRFVPLLPGLAEMALFCPGRPSTGHALGPV